MKKIKVNRRKALSTLVKGGLGITALGASGQLSGASLKTTLKEGKDVVPSSNKSQILYQVGCQHGGTGKENLEFLCQVIFFPF